MQKNVKINLVNPKNNKNNPLFLCRGDFKQHNELKNLFEEKN